MARTIPSCWTRQLRLISLSYDHHQARAEEDDHLRREELGVGVAARVSGMRLLSEGMAKIPAFRKVTAPAWPMCPI